MWVPSGVLDRKVRIPFHKGSSSQESTPRHGTNRDRS